MKLAKKLASTALTYALAVERERIRKMIDGKVFFVKKAGSVAYTRPKVKVTINGQNFPTLKEAASELEPPEEVPEHGKKKNQDQGRKRF